MTQIKNYNGEFVELNETEIRVLNEIQAVADYYGEGGSFSFDDINHDKIGLTENQLKGYISSLKKKDILDIYPKGEYYFDGGIIGWEYKKVWA